MLENGDLILVKDLSDMRQAIQSFYGNYSHVAIFWMVSSTMLVGKQVLFVKNLLDFLNRLISTIFMSIQSWKLTW